VRAIVPLFFIASEMHIGGSEIVQFVVSATEKVHFGLPLFAQQGFAQGTLRETLSTDWIAGVFLVLLIGLAYVKVAFPRRFYSVFRMFVALRFVRQAAREDALLTHGSGTILSLVFVFSGALLLVHTFDFFGWRLFLSSPSGFSWFLIFSAMIMAVYAVKYFGLWLVKFLFDTDSGLNQYLYDTWLINCVLGIALLPLLLIVTYSGWEASDTVLKIALGLVGLFYLYRLIRGISTGLSYNVSIFYLFLYLCTLEILPLIVFWAVFREQFNSFS